MNRGLCRASVVPHRQPVREPQLRVARPSGIVEVDHVAVGHPNCSQAHVAGTAQTKLNPAWPASAGQSNLSHRELVGQQVLFLAQRLVNERSADRPVCGRRRPRCASEGVVLWAVKKSVRGITSSILLADQNDIGGQSALLRAT